MTIFSSHLSAVSPASRKAESHHTKYSQTRISFSWIQYPDPLLAQSIAQDLDCQSNRSRSTYRLPVFDSVPHQWQTNQRLLYALHYCTATSHDFPCIPLFIFCVLFFDLIRYCRKCIIVASPMQVCCQIKILTR